MQLLLGVLAMALLAASCSGADAGGRAEKKVWTEDAFDHNAINQTLAQCAEEAGAEYEILIDGAFRLKEGPNVNRESGQEILDKCDERLVEAGLIPDPDRPRNAAELGLAHAAWAKTVACMRQHGWPTFGPPSRQAFDEAFDNPDALPPLYGPALEQLGFGAEFERLLETCPYTY